jgi:hypothetical protein
MADFFTSNEVFKGIASAWLGIFLSSAHAAWFETRRPQVRLIPRWLPATGLQRQRNYSASACIFKSAVCELDGLYLTGPWAWFLMLRVFMVWDPVP